MRALLSLSKLARRLPTSLPSTRTVPPLLLRHLHSDPTPPFQAPPPFVSRIIESEESPIPSTDSEHAQPEPDPVLDEFLTRLVTALRPTLAAAFPTHARPVLDEMLRLIAEAVLNRLPGADPAPGTVELSDDLWATVWEVSASVRDAMRRDQVRADLRNYLHSDDVKEMTRFAVDAGIRGSMLRELRFKWAREKLEEVEFYRGLDVMRAQADAASAPAALPPPPARLSALPQRKGEVKFSMYGLDLSDPKWAEVAERTAEAEAHFVPQEAKPVEGKAKKAEEKLLAVEPRKGDPLPAMEEWKEEHLPKRVDWMALLDRVKARNVELYLKVAEILLAEESFDATIRDYSKLIDLHSKANHVEDAEKLLGKMREKGIASDILTNITLVHMYSKAGNLEQAKQAFECIQKEGLQPDNKLFTSMISACINAGELKEAENLVKEMDSLSIKPTREIYMDVMRAYAERGLEDGFSRMKHAMTFAGFPPTLECFSLLIEVYGQTGDSDKARGMFEQLVQKIKKAGEEPKAEVEEEQRREREEESPREPSGGGGGAREIPLPPSLRPAMDPPNAGVTVIEPAKCRLMSLDEKRELVRELSKRPETAPEKLQSWSRRDIVEILCADLGRERKYTGLSKQRMLDYLFRVVKGKASSPAVHLQEKEPTPTRQKKEKEPTPDPNTSNHQQAAKRQRKSENPSRLPVVASNPVTADVPALPSNARFCLNLACRAILNLEDKFCRRCSCCICFNYDDNKDPSLWLFCSSEHSMQKDYCGFSCHLECALKDGRTGIMQSGQCKKLDGGYYCTRCWKQNDLLGSWKKQLVIAKDARRLDVLCYRIFLSHKVLLSTEKYLALHQIVDTAMKKLEAEVGPIVGDGNIGRGIVSRLTCGAEVQSLCAQALDAMESLFSVASPPNSQFQRSSMIPFNFIKFEPITQTSITVVFDLDQCPTMAQRVTGFHMWHRVASTGFYLSNPTAIVLALAPSTTYVVRELKPATSYILKIAAYSNSNELGSWEVRLKTSCQKEDDPKVSVPGGAGVEQNNGSPKTNSGGQSDRSSEGVDSNNNTTVYADLNKSPESDFEYCENPENLDSDKTSHHPNKPTDNSRNIQVAAVRVTEVIELDEAPGLSASALDEEPNSTVQTALLHESSNSIEQIPRIEIPISQDASNPTAVNESVIPPPRFSASMPPTAPRVMENGKDIGGRSFNTKPGDNMVQNGSSKPEREPGNSSNKRSGKFEDNGHKDGGPEASYEYCVRVVRWLECEGYIESNFRVKFLTWYSLRATLHERKIVSVYVNALIEDPVSLSGQLSDTFSEAIFSKRPPSVPSGFCMDLWH